MLEFIMYWGDEEVGRASAVFEKGKKTAYIACIEVRRKYRGRGFGKRLVGIVEKEARVRGYTNIWLISGYDTLGFWSKLGYVRVVRSGIKTAQFRKRLVPYATRRRTLQKDNQVSKCL